MEPHPKWNPPLSRRALQWLLRSLWPVLAYVFVIGLWTAALLFEKQQLSGIRGGG